MIKLYAILSVLAVFKSLETLRPAQRTTDCLLSPLFRALQPFYLAIKSNAILVQRVTKQSTQFGSNAPRLSTPCSQGASYHGAPAREKRLTDCYLPGVRCDMNRHA
eukprot:19070-Heterococcus_DN1.PRE.1